MRPLIGFAALSLSALMPLGAARLVLGGILSLVATNREQPPPQNNSQSDRPE